MANEIQKMPKAVALQGSDYSLVHAGTTHENKNTGPSHKFHVIHSGSKEPVGTMLVHQTSDGGYGGGSVELNHPDHASDAKAMKVFNSAKEHLFPAQAKGPVIDVEAKKVEKSAIERLDDLIKSVEEFEKMAPIVGAAIRGAAAGAVSGAIGSKLEKEDEKKKKEKAEKADLGEYWKKPPKKPESEAPTISYSGNSVKRTPGSASVEAGFKVPKEAQAPLKDPKFQTKLSEQRRASGFKKSEDEGTITSEALTKSILAKHSKEEVYAMIKAGVDEGKLHRNILMEFQNFGTINTAVIGALDEE